MGQLKQAGAPMQTAPSVQGTPANDQGDLTMAEAARIAEERGLVG